jgi:hypothetical protein
MRIVNDSVDLSTQRWPISYHLEEYYVAAGRYLAAPTRDHRQELCARRERVRLELDTHNWPRRCDVKAAWRVAACRRADDRQMGRCMCWRCGRSRGANNPEALLAFGAGQPPVSAKRLERQMNNADVVERALVLDYYEKGFHAGADPGRARRRRRIEPAMLKYEPHYRRGYEDGRRSAEQAARVYKQLLEQRTADSSESR